MPHHNVNVGFFWMCIYSVTLLLLSLSLHNCDTNDYYGQYSYYPNQARNFLPRLGNTPVIDPDVVYNGVVDPNNIAIHVMQNFINFAAGTLAWFLLSFTFQERTRRSLPESPIPITIKAPPYEFEPKDLFSQYYYKNEDDIVLDSSSSRTERVSRSANDSPKTKMLQIADMLRVFADTAESLNRYYRATIFLINF